MERITYACSDGGGSLGVHQPRTSSYCTLLARYYGTQVGLLRLVSRDWSKFSFQNLKCAAPRWRVMYLDCFIPQDYVGSCNTCYDSGQRPWHYGQGQ